MIRIITDPDIDRAKWDKCHSAQTHPMPYAFSWYLDIINPGWLALVIGDYDYIFPLTERKKWGIRYLCNPNFIQQLGSAGNVGAEKDINDAIIKYICSKYSFIDLCLSFEPEDRCGILTARENFTLDLSKQYNELSSAYSSACRRNIKLATEKKQELISDISPKEIISLFKINTGKKIRGVKSRDYNRFEELMDYCLASGSGQILGIRESGELIYAVFLINYNMRLTHLFTATTDRSRSLLCGYLVTDHIIQKFCGESYIFDFAGSSLPAVGEYIKSFGAEGGKYHRLYANNLPFFMRFLKE